MSLCRKTTFDELYTVLVELVTKVTARPCWRKMGIQVQPKGPYATVYLMEGPSAAQDVVEEVQDENGITQYPVGLTRLDCKVEFFRNVSVQPALEAAIRFRQALQVESRFQDLYQISGLVGEIRVIDVSAMFRSDVEGRAEIRFGLYADIGAPLLDGSVDNTADLIEKQQLDVFKTDTTPPAAATVNYPSL